MFPFNTDGIDVAGKDITIRDIVVSNYDDVVAVKAADLLSDKTGAVPGCTQNVTIYNTTVYRGAGLSIGSVHPSPLKPCVRDVLFERATLWSPLKGPYVKPDRATPECLHLDHDACSASISNVSYKHVRPDRSLSGECADTPTPSPRETSQLDPRRSPSRSIFPIDAGQVAPPVLAVGLVVARPRELQPIKGAVVRDVKSFRAPPLFGQRPRVLHP